MADTAKRTSGSKRMNAFPTIVFVIVLLMAVVVYLELIT